MLKTSGLKNGKNQGVHESFIAAMFFAPLSVRIFDTFYSVILRHNLRVPLS